MTKKKDTGNFQYPFAHKIETTSTEYTNVTPDFIDYLTLERELDIAGSEAITSDESINFPAWTPDEIKHASVEEVNHKKRRDFLSLLNLEPTELSYPTKQKKFKMYLFSLFGMLSEFVTFMVLCHYGFSMPKAESAVVALAVITFTKVMAWGKRKYIKDWMKTSNPFKRNLQKICFVCLSIAILLNSICFIFPRMQKLANDKKEFRVALLKSEIKTIQKIDKDSPEIAPIQAEIRKLQKELLAEDGLVLKFAKKLGLMLVSTLSIICSAILFAIALFYHDAYDIKKERDLVKSQIALELSRIKSYPKKVQMLTRMKREQIRSQAKINRLNKLISNKYSKS